MNTENFDSGTTIGLGNDLEAGMTIDFVKLLMTNPSITPAVSTRYKSRFMKKSGVSDIYMQNLTNIYNPPADDPTISKKTLNNIKAFKAKEIPKMTKSLRTREKVYQVNVGSKQRASGTTEERPQNSRKNIKKQRVSTTTTKQSVNAKRKKEPPRDIIDKQRKKLHTKSNTPAKFDEGAHVEVVENDTKKGNNKSHKSTNAPSQIVATEVNEKSNQVANGDQQIGNQVESLNDSMDLGFGADDLGITILEEIHNCIKCGEAISHPDYQKGFTEICPPCQNKEVNEMKSERTSTTSDEILVKMQHANSHMLLNNSDVEEEDDDNWPNILDPSEDKEKTRVGKEFQATIPSFSLNDPSYKVRKLRRLRWNPQRLEEQRFKFFTDSLDKKYTNLQLIQEELCEILVRFKYEVEKALRWCSKDNPEFQIYLKKSSQRRRTLLKIAENKSE